MKRVVLSTIVGATATLCAALPAAGREVTLNFATVDTPTTHVFIHVFKPWADAVNAKGKNVVRVRLRPGPTMANALNVYGRVIHNVAQVGWVLQSLVGGKFPLSEVAALPFISTDATSASDAFWMLYKSGLLNSEYDESRPLATIVWPQQSLHTQTPVRSLADLKGLKIRVSSKIASDMATRLGATPISMPLYSVYEALQRHTIDGLFTQWTAFQPFKLAEVTNYHVDAMLGSAPGMIFMAKKKYEALPAAARKVIDETSGASLSHSFGQFWDEQQVLGRKKTMSLKGQTLRKLTPAQRAEWDRRVKPVTAAWLKRTPGGAKVLAEYKADLAKASARDSH